MIEVEKLPVGKRFSLGFSRGFVEGVGCVLLGAVEQTRAMIMHKPIRDLAEGQATPVSVNPPVDYILQHVGDSWESYLFAFVTYNALSLIDSTQSAVTHRHIPQTVKLGLSVSAAMGLVGIYELCNKKQEPDLSDVLIGGSLGAALFVGANLLSRELVYGRMSNLDVNPTQK